MERKGWKKIKGFGGKYDIHHSGKIRSNHNNKTKYRKPRRDKDGYAIVDLKKDGMRKTVRVHNVVANHFLPSSLSRNQVNHEDGDKFNPHVRNLTRMTASENGFHSHRTGLYGRYRVNKHVRKKKNKVSVIRTHARNKKKRNFTKL